MQTRATPSAGPVDIISCVAYVLLLHKVFQVGLPLSTDG